ncbi:hypothetical protein COB21_04295, partial [Candidatus Aerophobetes bacterium]
LGRVKREKKETGAYSIEYDAMGQTTYQGDKAFQWDPWGQLIAVSDENYFWQAFYDGMGRRIQTECSEDSEPASITTTLFDPEFEFQEIGTRVGEKLFWKVEGPGGCNAIIEGKSGQVASLVYSGLNELTDVVIGDTAYVVSPTITAYGPQEVLEQPSDLLSFAQSLAWHSTSVDRTGLMLMGKRYYDPTCGRFLTPDPLSYPACVDLYAYTPGDPINYADLDGRFASPIYNSVKSKVLEVWDNSGFQSPTEMVGSMLNPMNSPVMRSGKNLANSFAYSGLGNSHSFQVGDSNFSKSSIGFMNGVGTTTAGAIKNVTQGVSPYANNMNINCTYNATNSLLIDTLECGAGLAGFNSTPVALLQKQYDHFVNTHGPDAKFLQICHSGATIHVKNFLKNAPEHVRQRIIVLAIAPATIIPEELCFRSYNYASKRDFVPKLDFIGNRKYGDQLHMLDPHPSAKTWDHDCLSRTFETVIQDHIEGHIKDYGDH